MIVTHFTAIFWNLKKIFVQKRWGQIIVAFTYLVILTLLFAFIFLLGLTTFRFLNTFSEASAPIIKYILLSALAFTAIISVVSFLISLSQRLFEKKLSFYFLAPVSSLTIFQAVFWENFLLGGWSFCVLALPVLLAYLVVSKSSPILYPLLFILLFFLTLFTESLGVILALFFRRYFRRASQKLIYLFTLAVFLVLGVFLKKFLLPAGLLEVAERPTLREVFTGLSSLPVANPWLPPALFIESLSQNFAAFFTFVFQTLIFYLLSLKMAKSLYHATWQKAQEGIFLALPHQVVSPLKRATKFQGLRRSLFKKESLLVDRSPSLLLYFAFVIFLALVYFFLLAQSPQAPEFYPSIFPKIASSTIMIIGYLITMLALRFSFPSLVSEFRLFWSLSRLPRGRFEIIRTKWIIYTFLPAATAWILGIFAFFLLRLPFDFLPFILGLCLSGSLLICGANLLVGTVWAPKLPRENVEQTTTALPAVIATLFSILVSFILGLFFYRLTTINPGGEISLVGGGGKFLNLITIIVSSFLFWFYTFRLGEKKFFKMDIH